MVRPRAGASEDAEEAGEEDSDEEEEDSDDEEEDSDDEEDDSPSSARARRYANDIVDNLVEGS